MEKAGGAIELEAMRMVKRQKEDGEEDGIQNEDEKGQKKLIQ